MKNKSLFKPRVKQKSLVASSESDSSDTESSTSVSSSPRKSNSFSSSLEKTVLTDPLSKYKTRKLTIKIDRNYIADVAKCCMPLRSKLNTEEKLATGPIGEESNSLSSEPCIKQEILDDIKSVVTTELVDTKPTIEKETADEKFLEKGVCPSNGLNLNDSEKVLNSLKLHSSNSHDESNDVGGCPETVMQPVHENGLEEKVTEELEIPLFERFWKGKPEQPRP